MEPDDAQARWADAQLAAELLAIDPAGLGGLCLRARAGPVRDRWLAQLRAALPPDRPPRRMPSHISESRLLGGLDLAATLAAARPVVQRGLLAESDGGLVLIPMAERLSPTTQAHLCAALDRGEVLLEREGLALRCDARIGVVALDEGIDDEERLGGALRDRLAFELDLSELRLPTPLGAAPDAVLVRPRVEAAQARLGAVEIDADTLEGLCAAAMTLGIESLRASQFAARVARVAAAREGRSSVSEADAALAARLVFAPRATRLPPSPQEAETDAEPPSQADQEPSPDPSPPPPAEDSAERDESASEELPAGPLEDLLLAAAQAAIPEGLLERLRAAERTRTRIASQGRSGALRQSLTRGRPAGARRGDPRSGLRLNLIETLRAAAPWQPLRRAQAICVQRVARRVEIRREDFHVTRYKQRQQTTTIFVVDASGSSALNRLAEAKGAVELLLAECYVRRDQVAVIAFRGPGAELLLPPTRSLVRAKRSLAGLPGGGGTPLAAGLDAGRVLGEQLRRRGETAVLVLLTDGRANIARDGRGSRALAEQEARESARALGASGMQIIFIDTSPRPQAEAQRLAADMAARYLALPHADARAVSAVVQAGIKRASR